jgi:hypothetical protein
VSANRLFLLAAAANGRTSTDRLRDVPPEPDQCDAGEPGRNQARNVDHREVRAALQTSFATGDSNIMFGLSNAWVFVQALKKAGKT